MITCKGAAQIADNYKNTIVDNVADHIKDSAGVGKKDRQSRVRG